MAKKGRRSRWAKRILVAGAVSAAGLGGLWIALHEIPWLGPWLAEGARSVVGPGPVAWAEDMAYGVADFVNVRTRSGDAPTTFWEVPAAQAAEAVAPRPGEPDPMLGAPARFDPPFPKVAADGDGTWIPVRSPADEGPVAMWKAMIHPDPKRPFAAVAVVAIDASQLEIQIVAGTDEPKSPHVLRADRPGLVPEADQDRVVAAFNGGFRAMHGNYGMRVGEQVFVPPRDIACTIGPEPGGGYVIRTFSAIEQIEPKLAWSRQTPPCLIENGAPNPGLLHEFNRNWGAAVGGDTIIRRSALGVSQDGKHLFYALGDAVTAQSLGRAMQTVGAHDAAQLDVNYSYPRFLLFEKGEGGPSLTAPLIPDLKYNPNEYVRLASQRDFFYVARKK